MSPVSSTRTDRTSRCRLTSISLLLVFASRTSRLMAAVEGSKTPTTREIATKLLPPTGSIALVPLGTTGRCPGIPSPLSTGDRSMPFDALALAAVTDEIAATAVGGRIQKILQPSAASVALSLYNQGTRAWLLLSADAQ